MWKQECDMSWGRYVGWWLKVEHIIIPCSISSDWHVMGIHRSHLVCWYEEELIMMMSSNTYEVITSIFTTGHASLIPSCTYESWKHLHTLEILQLLQLVQAYSDHKCYFLPHILLDGGRLHNYALWCRPLSLCGWFRGIQALVNYRF